MWLCAATVVLMFAVSAARTIRQHVVWQQRLSTLHQISSSGGNNTALAALFLSPTKVEAYRMQPIWHSEPAPTIGKIDGFNYSAKRTGLSRDFATRLGALVLTPDTYTDEAKACAFNPTVAFRVSQSSKWANVIICLSCSQIIVVEPQAPTSSIGGVKARFRVAGEFDHRRAEFLALAREAFPSDVTLK